MKTPIGSIRARMTFTDESGTLTGTATGRDETVPLERIRSEKLADGERVTWSQRITKPMRLNLEFDVLVVADEMTGSSGAGRLPRSEVHGVRSIQT